MRSLSSISSYKFIKGEKKGKSEIEKSQRLKNERSFFGTKIKIFYNFLSVFFW